MTIQPTKTKRGRGSLPALTPEQAAEAFRRDNLRRANTRKRVAADLGISVQTLNVYLHGFTPKVWSKP